MITLFGVRQTLSVEVAVVDGLKISCRCILVNLKSERKNQVLTESDSIGVVPPVETGCRWVGGRKKRESFRLSATGFAVAY